MVKRHIDRQALRATRPARQQPLPSGLCPTAAPLTFPASPNERPDRQAFPEQLRHGVQGRFVGERRQCKVACTCGRQRAHRETAPLRPCACDMDRKDLIDAPVRHTRPDQYAATAYGVTGSGEAARCLAYPDRARWFAAEMLSLTLSFAAAGSSLSAAWYGAKAPSGNSRSTQRSTNSGSRGVPPPQTSTARPVRAFSRVPHPLRRFCAKG